MSSRLHRIALFGTGNIARSHVNAVRSLAERAELVAAMDIDGERVAAFALEHEIPAYYTDAAQLLAEARPDVVLIATPPGVHCALSVQAMEAGAWVLCEKPLCASLAEMDRLEEAERRTGNYTSSVFQWRFGSGGRHLKRLIEQGALGRPYVGSVLTTWYRTTEYYSVPWRGKWETEVGGTTMTHGIHVMDFVLWLLGEWSEVRAMVGTLHHDIEVDDVSMVLTRFANGAMTSMVNSAISPRQESYLRLDFERATVELRQLYSYRNEHWRYSIPEGASHEDELAEWQRIGEDVPSTHAPQLAAFLDAYERGERPPVSGPDVRGTLEFLTAIYKAGLTGESVVRGSITPDDPFYSRLYGPDPKALAATRARDWTRAQA